MRVLNRVVAWEADRITLEADQRHAEIVVDMLGLGDSRGVSTPGVKGEDEQQDTALLEPSECTRFRGKGAAPAGGGVLTRGAPLRRVSIDT